MNMQSYRWALSQLSKPRQSVADFQHKRHHQGCREHVSKQSEQSKQLSTVGEDHGDSEPAGAPNGPSNSESQLPTICLKQVFPKYAKQFNYLRLLERMANLFIRFLGIKGTMKLGPTGFRTFIRNCKLSSSSFSMAAVDILYIDITRRWNAMTLDQRDSGMCLQAFAEAFFYLAQKKFKMPPLHAQVASLVDLCEYHLALLDEKRLMRGRSGTAATTGRRPGSNTPSSTQPEVDAKLGPCTGGAHKLATPRHTVP